MAVPGPAISRTSTIPPSAFVRGVISDQNRVWIRWLVTIVVSGFLFAYVSVDAGAIWLTLTLLIETFSAWARARLIAGDESMQRWHVGAIFAISIAWVAHAALLWMQPEEMAHISAIMDLFTVALYGAIGGHKDKRILFALMAPPLLALASMLIHFAWTQAPFVVSVIATLATLGACATIVGNGWALHRSDHELTQAHADLQMERDALETRVAERTRDLQQAHAALETASRAKSVFLRTMSHELRTPLNGILGYAEMLAEDIEAGDAKPADAEKIVASGRRLLQLINDVLDLASLEAGQATVTLEETDIENLVSAACRAVADVTADNGNTISVRVEPDARLAVTDAKRLSQVLRHIVDNACKFTNQGAVRIEVARRSTGDRQLLELTVADTGPGISANDLKRLFEPFEQASQGMTRTHEGAGLGLAITRRMMALLGGDVAIHSTPGQGTRVTLTLPV